MNKSDMYLLSNINTAINDIYERIDFQIVDYPFKDPEFKKIMIETRKRIENAKNYTEKHLRKYLDADMKGQLKSNTKKISGKRNSRK